MTISRRQRKKTSAEQEIKIMETSPITKQANEILKILQQQVYEDPLDKYSYFENNEVEAASVSRDSKGEEKNISRVKELTGL